MLKFRNDLLVTGNPVKSGDFVSRRVRSSIKTVMTIAVSRNSEQHQNKNSNLQSVKKTRLSPYRPFLLDLNFHHFNFRDF